MIKNKVSIPFLINIERLLNNIFVDSENVLVGIRKKYYLCIAFRVLTLKIDLPMK